ncbi:hypothetical protein AAFC00_004332 [Neodothiora populina]|uniref:UBC core domain-containing protein n=1 Tax=Neodothiora populina TaxID=2781224 RepID=A0ABR3PJC8_9PEZI
MPRKAYIEDLKQAQEHHGVDSICDLCPGDDDGQFRFIFRHDLLEQCVTVTAGVTDLSDYPTDHDYFIFAADDTPPDIAAILSSKLPSAKCKTVRQLLSSVSETLLKHCIVRGDDVDMPESQSCVEDDMQSEADYEYDSGADDGFGDDFCADPSTTDVATKADRFVETTALFQRRIRSDLRLAKLAGSKIGVLRDPLEGDNCFVSVSVRCAKLGISDHAMQAWNVEPSDYLTLIIQYPSYRTLDQLLGSDSIGLRPTMRVGASKKYKPTMDEATSAFSSANTRNTTASFTDRPTAPLTGFRSVFMSKSLENLLNERLISILQYREIGLSRSGAEEFYTDNRGASPLNSGSIADKYFAPDALNATYPPIVDADHWTDTCPEGLSFPLLAAQMLLRHFVRCTEFCVVCHRKLHNDIEAIKPYVCDGGLCLFQYVTMGFGPSFEHEIATQPYTIDLLVSFAYAQAQAGTLKEFPLGLGMTIPSHFAERVDPCPRYMSFHRMNGQKSKTSQEPTTPKTTSGEAPIKRDIKVDLMARKILFPEMEQKCPVNVGEWVSISLEKDKHLQCCISSIHYPVISTGPFISSSDHGIETNIPELPRKAPGDKTSPGKWISATMERHETEFDTLDDNQKCGAIKNLLNCLHSICDIKSYLSTQRIPDLARARHMIPPATLSTLRWVIASNRACIMQAYDDDPVTGLPAPKDTHVYGMKGWMQFRFAMGAPDKEKRFLKCVHDTAKLLKPKHATLFAFHGSALQNWHSIIREGLHYENTVNGRAYGNGVYHSLSLTTSLGYSGTVDQSWPQSMLRIRTAIALNEIVNAPGEFVSRSPHLVVQHVDWIQTRYLFIKCNEPNFCNLDEKKPEHERVQDPSVIPRASEGYLVISACSSPSSKRKIKNSFGKATIVNKRVKGSGLAHDPITLDAQDDYLGDDDLSDETDTDDRNILVDGVSIDSKFNDKVNQSVLRGGFVPGGLNHDDLPKLSMPGYATTSATTRLNQDFKALLKLQNSTPLHELGWYIDPELFDCPYQWIIELHSFEEFGQGDTMIPLVDDMKAAGAKSIILEVRFSGSYPHSPPFVRVIKPRFLPFQNGGGGHVTAGGALCMELLTNSGWSVASTMESVLLQVRLEMASLDPRPARLEKNRRASSAYGLGEAIEAYKRACKAHEWEIPADFHQIAYE